MKHFTSIFIFISILLFSTNTQAQKHKKESRVIIKSMLNCEVCAEAIEDELDDISGIKSIEIDMNENKIIITYDSYQLNPERIREAISEIGFPADDLEAHEDAYKELPDCCKKPEDQEGQRSDEVEEKTIEIDED